METLKGSSLTTSHDSISQEPYDIIINDMQNGFMNENTDYLPSAISSFMKSNPFHIDNVIMTTLVGKPESWPQDRAGKAGAVKTLSDDFESRLVSPFPINDCSIVTHTSYTDIRGLKNSIKNMNVLLCGMETDSIIITAAMLRDSGYHVSIIYDLTATTLGTGTQIAMMGVMQHLFGADSII